MFGFFIGAACVAGLAMMAGRHHRYHHGYAGHHGCGGGGYGRGCGGGGYGGRSFFRRGLRRIFERLDTSPGQEKTILHEIDTIRERMRAAAENVRGARTKVEEAFRQDTMDEQTASALFDAPLEELRAVRDELARALSIIHETLTPEQRERLSRMGRFRWGYGY
jgi:Spy/CpxP family protein refolding chaperone